MGLVRHDEDIVVGIDRLRVGFVEFLNEGKNKTGIATQLLYQIFAAGGNKLAGFGLAQQAAIFEGVTDLLVQLIPVSEDDNGGRACELPSDLLGQEHHGIALAAALGVPEDAQLAVVQFSGLVSLHCLVDTKILMIAGQDLGSAPAGVVIEDEVLQQIQKVFLFAYTPQHSLQGHAARLLLAKALPLVEELILAAQRAHLGLQAVGEDEKGVVVKQVGDGVQIVGVVVRIGVLDIHRVLFQLYKQQGNSIHKAHNIGAAAVEVAVDF